ncbi:hypothetical protein AGR1A_Cc40224 [Agrobacterium fabacearum CFBP 5771]|uniref:hypothetical protein n=1 Tax=Agrobacterium tumefaciens TaxID=358 RepID=UPI0009BBB124|nr:hypothetical protein [Agrobacterium tumefaciens]CVI17432.1 hypothetical protein AGR1A_Cc40224 [Agrobacterium fabacearum CFBP 5771]
MKTALDFIAIIVAFLALIYSITSGVDSEKAVMAEAANRFCVGFFLGNELKDQRAAIRGASISPMEPNVNRAYGDIFNYLNIAALNWSLKKTDTELLRKCLGAGFLMFCNKDVASQLQTRWHYLEKLVVSRSFWESEVQHHGACFDAMTSTQRI